MTTHTNDPAQQWCQACSEEGGTGDWQMCPDCGNHLPLHAMIDHPQREIWLCPPCYRAGRQTAEMIFGSDAVLFVTETDEGVLPGTDEAAPGTQLMVGEWADGDLGVIIATPDGHSATAHLPRDHAHALLHALDGFLFPKEGAELVTLIRTICARELGGRYDYPYFNLDYRPGETPDEALVRMFTAERPNHATDEATVLVMCHG